MIVKDKRDRYRDELGDGDPLLSLTPDDPSAVPPPPFEDIASEPSGSQPTGVPEGPPPDFAPYEADHFEVGSGDIVSHDPHLNTDGEALYRFLLAQAEKTPTCVLHCRGTHSEYRTRWVTHRHNDGHVEERPETYSETVTDFDFYIDASPRRTTKPTHWSVADSEPAYRGLMVREVGGGLQGTRVAKRSEVKAHERWAKERRGAGLPPWMAVSDDRRDGAAEVTTLKSSKTLRQWADEYCASPKYLKEFVYEKNVYGWNLQQLESAVRALIITTMYRGRLEVDFKIEGSKVYIRPDNKLSRMLSNRWLKFLSIILFIFPFIWLFKRFHKKGGGRWEVCGGAYALKRWVPVNPEESLLDDVPPTGPSEYRAKLDGMREGEWLGKWEGTITRAVVGRYQNPTPLTDMTEPSTMARLNLAYLDGYRV